MRISIPNINSSSKRSKTSSSGPRYVSIKIPALDADASHEIAQSKIIANANASHPGLAYLRIPIDEFQLRGPQGTHSCLVYEPMRETLYNFQRRMPRSRLPGPVFKSYMFLLLQALDYLHTECHLIHTGKNLNSPYISIPLRIVV